MDKRAVSMCPGLACTKARCIDPCASQSGTTQAACPAAGQPCEQRRYCSTVPPAKSTSRSAAHLLRVLDLELGALRAGEVLEKVVEHICDRVHHLFQQHGRRDDSAGEDEHANEAARCLQVELDVGTPVLEVLPAVHPPRVSLGLWLRVRAPAVPAPTRPCSCNDAAVLMHAPSP